MPSDAPLHLRFGPRDLWLHFQQGEIRISTGVPAADGDPDAPEHPDPGSWSRWATPNGERDVLLRPALPDRAVVLEPELPFVLLPRTEARIYVRVPLWLRIEADVGGGTVLEEVPIVDLSDTWWGGFIEGELCYWLHTTARREIRPELVEPHVAICPLQLVNQAAVDLRVEKLAFRVAHLTLFAHGTGFWADTSRVRYQGETEGSRIDMMGRAPREAEGATMVTPPRSPAARGLRERTFARLRSLPGLGGGG